MEGSPPSYAPRSLQLAAARSKRGALHVYVRIMLVRICLFFMCLGATALFAGCRTVYLSEGASVLPCPTAPTHTSPFLLLPHTHKQKMATHP